MNAAKSRMSNYLNSVKPQKNPQKLLLDQAMPTRAQDRTYDNALALAVSPLSIMKHVKNGTLQQEHVKHLNALYPELVQHLQKKITARLMQAHLDEDSLPGKTKQAMALLLGSPLETWMTPQGIMAAQATFLPKQPPQGQQGQALNKPKKGTTNLGKSNSSYKTADQSAESDRSSRKD
jgi:hypothetical protein